VSPEEEKKGQEEAIAGFNKTIDKRFAPYIDARVVKILGFVASIDLVGKGKDARGVDRSNSEYIRLIKHSTEHKFKVLTYGVKRFGLPIKAPIARKQKTAEMAGVKLAQWFNKNADALISSIEEKYGK
jgi:hypothetical protein